MSLAHARKLMVDGKVYQWKVSANGGKHLAIFDVERQKKFVKWFTAADVITPAVVRTEIGRAKKIEWK